VRPLVRQRKACWTVEHDEGELRQVDPVDLHEDLLPYSRICCRLFLSVEGIQGRIAVEVNVVSLRRELVAREQGGIVGVIAKAVLKLGNVIPVRYGSHRRGCLSLRQQGTKEGIVWIVLDVELNADLLEVALNNAFNVRAIGMKCRPLYWLLRLSVLKQSRKQHSEQLYGHLLAGDGAEKGLRASSVTHFLERIADVASTPMQALAYSHGAHGESIWSWSRHLFPKAGQRSWLNMSTSPTCLMGSQ
jgi:hypothetical protein